MILSNSGAKKKTGGCLLPVSDCDTHETRSRVIYLSGSTFISCENRESVSTVGYYFRGSLFR